MAIINPFIAIVGFTCVGNYVILSASIQKGGNLIIYYLFLLPAISGKLKLSVGISLVGLTLGLYNTLFVKALGVLDHVVLYPVSEILSTCLIALGDRILFDNHFTKKQLVGLAFAVATVTLLNL